MRNFRTSKYKKIYYFVQQNGGKWDVVEFPTNDIVRTFAKKKDAELFSEQLTHTKPFGNAPLPNFMKGNIDILE